MISKLRNTTFSKALVAVLATAVLSALAFPALAGASASDDQYKNTKDQIAVLAKSSGGGTAAQPTSNEQVGSLPFTGLDVLGLFAVAVVFAGSGLLLQRAVRKQQ
jgi:hypothetical protein